MLRSSLFAALLMGGSSALAATVNTSPDSVDLSSVALDSDVVQFYPSADGAEACEKSVATEAAEKKCYKARTGISVDERLQQLVAVR